MASDENIVKGKILDAKTKEALPGAVVSIPDLKKIVQTDNLGNFELEGLPAKGRYILQISFIGYKTINLTIDLEKPQFYTFSMESSSIEAGEVIVTGVSKATELKKSPIPIVAINKTFIEQHAGAGNVIELISNIPGVSAVTTGPNISKPFIHGLGYNRVVTLMDGIRQEGQQWGDEHGIEVDQNSIDRIEVIKGPASLSYGSDAIGGVVNLISPSPISEGQTEGSFQTLYGTNQDLWGASLRLQGNQKGWVWGTILSGKLAKNYQNPHDGRVWETGYFEKDARIMGGISRSWGSTYLNASIFDDLQDIPDGSRDPLSRKFTKKISDIDSIRTIVSQKELNAYSIPVLHQHVQLYRVYSNSTFVLGTGNLLVNLGYQYSHRREFTHPQNADIPGLNLNLYTLTYDFKYNFNLGNAFETSLGLNGMYQQNKLTYGTVFPIPAYNQWDIGPFFIVKKSLGKLDLSGGIRLDERFFTGLPAFVDTAHAFFPILFKGPNPFAQEDIIQQFPSFKKTFSGTSGSLGATYNFSDEFLVKANIARGFRAPSISELSANGPDPGSQIYHVGNPNFKPEFSTQEDLGAFFAFERVSASIEAFTNHIQNYIFQEEILDAAGNPQRVNPDGSANSNGQYLKFTYVQTKARIQGGEINIDIHPVKWLHFQNAISLTYGQNLGSGKSVPDSLKYLPFMPPLHTHSELRASLSKYGNHFQSLYISLSLDHFNPQKQFFSAYGTETYTGGYNLLNAGFGGNWINTKGQTVLKFYLEGKNLANIAYQSNMSRLKYFDNPVVPPGIQPGIFNIGRNIDFKLVMPFSLSNGTGKI